MTSGFELFDTPVGSCGIAWSDRAVTGVELADITPQVTLGHLQRRFPTARRSAPSDVAVTAIEGIAALLRGERPDLDAIPVDLDPVSPFERSVYDAARRIPPGTTRTYGELAAEVAGPGAARAVGRALGRNPVPILVPCHRVVAVGGRPGGFSAPGGASTKRRLLDLEAGRCLW